MVNGISSTTTASLYQARENLFSRTDTSSDGSIDKNELTQLLQQDTTNLVSDIFSQLDTDQDNLISQIEAQSGLAKMERAMKNEGGEMAPTAGGSPPPPQEVFDSADTNEDGVVSKAELAAVMGQSEEGIGEIFSQVDTDGDGVISRAEDDAWLQKMESQTPPNGSLPATSSSPEAGQGIFAKADANGDGSVSKAELEAVIGKDVDSLFAKIDTDGDGAVSQAEDKTWLSKTDPGAGQTASTTANKANTASSTEDWRATMFFALLRGLTASAGASVDSTSVYA